MWIWRQIQNEYIGKKYLFTSGIRETKYRISLSLEKEDKLVDFQEQPIMAAFIDSKGNNGINNGSEAKNQIYGL